MTSLLIKGTPPYLLRQDFSQVTYNKEWYVFGEEYTKYPSEPTLFVYDKLQECWWWVIREMERLGWETWDKGIPKIMEKAFIGCGGNYTPESHTILRDPTCSVYTVDELIAHELCHSLQPSWLHNEYRTEALCGRQNSTLCERQAVYIGRMWDALQRGTDKPEWSTNPKIAKYTFP